MPAQKPLSGTELIDCAKANAKQGIKEAAYNCGYGEDLAAFQASLKQACEDIGVEINELSDLITDQQIVKNKGGLEIAPDSPSSL
ncbi:MAG: hypothetical protein WBA77_06970 [Microcoleaceae cyanobacterium]